MASRMAKLTRWAPLPTHLPIRAVIPNSVVLVDPARRVVKKEARWETLAVARRTQGAVSRPLDGRANRYVASAGGPFVCRTVQVSGSICQYVYSPVARVTSARFATEDGRGAGGGADRSAPAWHHGHFGATPCRSLRSLPPRSPYAPREATPPSSPGFDHTEGWRSPSATTDTPRAPEGSGNFLGFPAPTSMCCPSSAATPDSSLRCHLPTSKNATFG